ncbi:MULTISPECIES: hypothetical protein [Persephonella]|uniref:hypothetical protein n=1 Tax=Persephonella TaxID=182899 RepID=UPI001EE66F0D|nr:MULTISPECIES: hypothetical protein [Persephonella]
MPALKPSKISSVFLDISFFKNTKEPPTAVDSPARKLAISPYKKRISSPPPPF